MNDKPFVMMSEPTPSPPPEEPPLSLRIDLSAHHAAQLRAQAEGCSVSDVLLRALRLGLESAPPCSRRRV